MALCKASFFNRSKHASPLQLTLEKRYVQSPCSLLLDLRLHIETMAQAIAEGARSAGSSVDVKRVPETVPEEIAKSAHFKIDQAAPSPNQ